MSRTPASVAVPASGRWLRILVYYAVAISLSAFARLAWHATDVSSSWPSFGTLRWHLISGVGPFIGAAIVWAVFRPRRTMSFGGTKPALAFAMLAVPAGTLGVIGIVNPLGVDPHVYGFYIGAWIAVYAVLEETGWRGYLQDELGDLPRLWKYTIVGLFWYPWHLTFLGQHSLSNEFAILGLIVGASIGIGYVADRTRSIFAAASFHVIGNILGLTAYFTILIPASSTRLRVAGICAVVLMMMLRLWRRSEAQDVAPG